MNKKTFDDYLIEDVFEKRSHFINKTFGPNCFEQAKILYVLLFLFYFFFLARSFFIDSGTFSCNLLGFIFVSIFLLGLYDLVCKSEKEYWENPGCKNKKRKKRIDRVGIFCRKMLPFIFCLSLILWSLFYILGNGLFGLFIVLCALVIFLAEYLSTCSPAPYSKSKLKLFLERLFKPKRLSFFYNQP